MSEDADVGAYIGLIDGERLEDARRFARAVRDNGFHTPLWALADTHRLSNMAIVSLTGEVDGYIYLGNQSAAYYAKQVIASVVQYGLSLLPPFFGGLMAYDSEATIAFDCPGHQGGQFFRKSPAGQLFFKHFGESLFRNDLCNADVDLGDLLIHEGPAAEAQNYAAKVFGADRTYFVLNGTSTSNKVVTNAVLRRGDLVLFDRNNHKSLHQGALVQAGAIPIFLPTSRNPFGMIGAVDWDAWDEDYLRQRIKNNPYEALVANDVDYVPLGEIKGRISATLALIYPPGIGVIVPGERWDDRARPMLEYFLAFEESFNRFPGFNYEVQGVFQERVNGRIKFHTYVVRE